MTDFYCPYCNSLIPYSSDTPLGSCPQCGAVFRKGDIEEPQITEDFYFYHYLSDTEKQQYILENRDQFTRRTVLSAFCALHKEHIKEGLYTVGVLLFIACIIALAVLVILNFSTVCSWIGKAISWLFGKIWEGISALFTSIWHGIFG